jgi:hypothetical protein
MTVASSGSGSAGVLHVGGTDSLTDPGDSNSIFGEDFPLFRDVVTNASASLFVAAKIAHLGPLPQGQPERNSRVLGMVAQAKAEMFGSWLGDRRNFRALFHVKEDIARP